MKDLGRRTRRGVSWSIAGNLISNVLRLTVYAVLGRLLEKRDFGIVASALTLVQFGNTVRDLGIGVALVQRKELDREHVEAGFVFSVGLGLVVGALAVAAAGPVARFYNIPDSVSIVRCFGLIFLFRGVAIVPSYMCQREMSFRALAIVDVASYAFGAATTITLAVMGNGAWSLALGTLVETFTGMVILLILAPPPLRLRVHARHLRELLGFGVGQTVANIANYFANQGDYMVVGHYLGPGQLGLYQRAYELMRFPSTVFSQVAGNVLFSAFAKVQDDAGRLGRAFRQVMFASSLVLLPASAGMIVLAPEVIRAVLGPGWGEAVGPFRIMAISMLFRTTYKLGGIVARSTGDIYRIAGWQVLYALLVMGGAMVSKRFGIVGVATTTAVAVSVHFVALSRLGLLKTTLGARSLVAPIARCASYAVLVGAAAWIVAFALRGAGMSYAVIAAAATVAGTAAFGVIVFVKVRGGTEDWPWLRGTVVDIIKGGRKRAQPAER